MIKKLILPVSIIVGCIILGFFFYITQVSKQKSIERQQQAKIESDEKQHETALQEEAKQQEEKIKLENLKMKQEECKELSVGVKRKWGNVMGVVYDDDIWKECVVTYTDPDSGKIETAPLSMMENSK